MSKTMLRIVAIVLIVSIVAFSGCLGDKKPAEVEPTPEATPAATPEATPAATPAETPAATPAVEETKIADAEEGFIPKSSDRPPLEVPSGGCEGLDQKLLARCDNNNNGLIDSNEMEAAKIGYENNYEKPSDYAQILYAYEHNCTVESTE
jgi:PBP1b-binding outer membrane lipoprotein LpoB